MKRLMVLLAVLCVCLSSCMSWHGVGVSPPEPLRYGDRVRITTNDGMIHEIRVEVATELEIRGKDVTTGTKTTIMRADIATVVRRGHDMRNTVSSVALLAAVAAVGASAFLCYVNGFNVFH